MSARVELLGNGKRRCFGLSEESEQSEDRQMSKQEHAAFELKLCFVRLVLHDHVRDASRSFSPSAFASPSSEWSQLKTVALSPHCTKSDIKRAVAKAEQEIEKQENEKVVLLAWALLSPTECSKSEKIREWITESISEGRVPQHLDQVFIECVGRVLISPKYTTSTIPASTSSVEELARSLVEKFIDTCAENLDPASLKAHRELSFLLPILFNAVSITSQLRSSISVTQSFHSILKFTQSLDSTQRERLIRVLSPTESDRVKALQRRTQGGTRVSLDLLSVSDELQEILGESSSEVSMSCFAGRQFLVKKDGGLPANDLPRALLWELENSCDLFAEVLCACLFVDPFLAFELMPDVGRSSRRMFSTAKQFLERVLAMVGCEREVDLYLQHLLTMRKFYEALRFKNHSQGVLPTRSERREESAQRVAKFWTTKLETQETEFPNLARVALALNNLVQTTMMVPQF